MSETVSTASNAAGAWTNPLRDPRDLRLPRIAGPCSIVIFGVTGDLSRKKLLPAIYDLANRGLLPPSFGLTGFAAAIGPKSISRISYARTSRRTAVRHSRNRLGSSLPTAFVSCRAPSTIRRRSNDCRRPSRNLTAIAARAATMRSTCPCRHGAFPQVSRQPADCGLAKSDKGALASRDHRKAVRPRSGQR